MPTKISATDKAILQLLQRDAALSTAEIADKVGLSQSPCWRRIRRLEEAGVIERRVALLNHEALGMEVVAFVTVKLSEHGRQNLEDFERQVARLPEVLECFTVTGDVDYILKIVSKDIRHFESFLRNELMTMTMIRETHSAIAVTEIKDTTELPLATQL
ncbi:MAG: Lrp/AsnC family transcriptional regulator [Arenicellales bacterium]|jgi:Lrp/AsnC family transcriptional regulator